MSLRFYSQVSFLLSIYMCVLKLWLRGVSPSACLYHGDAAVGGAYESEGHRDSVPRVTSLAKQRHRAIEIPLASVRYRNPVSYAPVSSDPPRHEAVAFSPVNGQVSTFRKMQLSLQFVFLPPV